MMMKRTRSQYTHTREARDKMNGALFSLSYHTNKIFPSKDTEKGQNEAAFLAQSFLSALIIALSGTMLYLNRTIARFQTQKVHYTTVHKTDKNE